MMSEALEPTRQAQKADDKITEIKRLKKDLNLTEAE